MKKIVFLILCLFTGIHSFAQKKYTVNEIPDPKQSGQDYFVSDPDQLLSNADSINRLITKVEKLTKTEIAVVIVKDFDTDQNEFDFGMALFRQWGIGKKGADNGLLLFAATDRRKYRFITGYGLEGLLPDVALKHIAERNLLPAFRTENYDEGIINSLNAISTFLTNPNNEAEIKQLMTAAKKDQMEWKDPTLYSALILLFFVSAWLFVKKRLPDAKPKVLNKKAENSYDKTISFGCIGIFFFLFVSVFVIAFFFNFDFLKSSGLIIVPIILYIILALVLFFRYIGALSILRKLHQDDQNFFESARKFNKSVWWLSLGSPLILPAILWNARSRVKLGAERFKPLLDTQGNAMSRMDRDLNMEGKPYLTAGQRKEETLQVYDYDIWESADHKEHQIKAWPAETYYRYSECPECGFRTFDKPRTKTIKAATYSTQGEGKEIRECRNCNHEEFIRNITLAMLVKESSSSGGSSSGSSSSSSSGSWGGGSSGGGGTGGSW